MHNKTRFEIENAVWELQAEIRPVCLICQGLMNMIDAESGHAVCWTCRKKVFPDQGGYGKISPDDIGRNGKLGLLGGISYLEKGP